MNKSSLLTSSLGVLASLTFISSQAFADIAITAVEENGDVVFSYSGSLRSAEFSSPTGFIRSGAMNPGNSLIYFATVSGSESVTTYPAVTSAPSSFGTGGNTPPSSESGESFTVNETTISLPTTYSSGDPLSGTLTFNSATFSSLGIDPTGSPYVWTLSNAETVTLAINSPSVATPVASAVQTATLKKIKKLKKKLKAAKKKGQKAKAKKIKKQIKALKQKL